MSSPTRWAWIDSSTKMESGWMTEKQFRQRFGSKNWKDQWDTAPQDEMPSEHDFKRHYGISTWKRHYDWHQESDEDQEIEEQKSVEPRGKRKRVQAAVWSPRVEPPRRKRKKKTAPPSSSSSTSTTSSSSTTTTMLSPRSHAQHRERNDAFRRFRTKCLREAAKVTFHQQYLLAHLSDTKGKDSDSSLLDQVGLAIARAHIAWGKHALRNTILELLGVNCHHMPLSSSHFDEDGIDADQIDCCACLYVDNCAR